jgi:hypothetical protein
MPSHLRAGIAAFVSLALVFGCTSSTEPAALAYFDTDRGSYIAVPLNPPGLVEQYGFTVVTTIRNHWRTPLFLESCGDSPNLVFGVELLGASDPEGSAYNGAWSCPGGLPRVLMPNSERVDTLMFRGPNVFTGGAQPQPQGTLQGRMQVVIEVRTCAMQSGCTSETTSRVVRLRSSEFTVQTSPRH